MHDKEVAKTIKVRTFPIFGVACNIPINNSYFFGKRSIHIPRLFSNKQAKQQFPMQFDMLSAAAV